MRIVFFGEDAFSCIVLESLIIAKHMVLGVYCPTYNNKIYLRIEKLCTKHNIPFFRIANFSSSDLIDSLNILKIELIVVCHFQKIIGKDLIKLPKLGCINLHPSLLPQYRGMSPQHWPIINGDNETGITVHFIDEGIDTGDIILQHKIKIESEMYVFDLQNHMKKIYSTIVKDAINLIGQSNASFIKQAHLTGSYYGKLSIKDCEIGEFMSVNQALNLIRGVSSPYFGARYQNLIIWKAKLVKNDEFINFDKPLQPAKLIHIQGENYLEFYDGLLKIEKSETYEK